MNASRLTIEERRYEQVRGDLFHADTMRQEAKALPRAYQAAVKRYRKALYRFHLAEHHPALIKPWESYAGQRGRKSGGGYGIVKYHKPEADGARQADESLLRARDSMADTRDRLGQRQELLDAAKTDMARLKPQVEVFRRLAEESRARLDKKKAEVAARPKKAQAVAWVELEPGKAIMGKPFAAWKRTFTARRPVAVTMSRENGSFVFQHPTGELRLNWKAVDTLTGKEREGLQTLTA